MASDDQGWAAPDVSPPATAAPGAEPGAESVPPGWWLASDGRWYPPAQATGAPGGAWPGDAAGGGATKSRPAVVIVLSVALVLLVVFATVSLVRLGKSDRRQAASERSMSEALRSVPTTQATHLAGAADGFTAEFPIEPARTETPVDVKGLHLISVSYEAVSSSEDVGVAVAKFPAAVPAANLQRSLDATIDGIATKLSETVVSRANLTYVGVPAEDAVLKAPDRIVHVRSFYVGARLFQIIDATDSSDPPRPNFERLLATFAVH